MSWRCTRPIGRTGRDVRGIFEKVLLLPVRPVLAAGALAVRGMAAAGAGPTVAGALPATGPVVVPRAATRAAPVALGVVSLAILALGIVALPVVIVRSVVPRPVIRVVRRVVMEGVRAVLVGAPSMRVASAIARRHGTA